MQTPQVTFFVSFCINTNKASFLYIHTWLLNESECVVFCLHHDPVANRVVFLKECLYIQLKQKNKNVLNYKKKNTACLIRLKFR